MKVIIVGQFGLESFGLHIKENLTLMGHEVVACVPFYQENISAKRNKKPIVGRIISSFDDKLRFSSAGSRQKVMGRIIGEVTKHQADLVICTKDYFLDYEIEQIKRKTGSKVIMWFPDHMITFGRATFMNAGYDCLFFKDPYIVKELRRIYKRNAVYLPECYSPIRHQMVDYNAQDENNYKCDIAMIGNLHSFRVPLMEFLTEYELKIYGTANPWWLNINKIKEKYTGKYMAYEEKSKAIKYAKINLNTLFIGEVEGVNVRAFEICGMGGFQILQNKPGVNDLFEIGREVVTYSSKDELIEKIDYYLKHETERNIIATAGQIRASKDHTYERRLNRIINFTFSEGYSEEDYYNYRAHSECK